VTYRDDTPGLLGFGVRPAPGDAKTFLVFWRMCPPKSFSLQEFFGATVKAMIVAKSAHKAPIDIHYQFSLARTRT
jgi:hypothetical protein